MDRFTDSLHERTIPLSESVINKVITQSVTQNVIPVERSPAIYAKLRSLFADNLLELGGVIPTLPPQKNLKRRLADDNIVSSFLTDLVRPVGLVQGFYGQPESYMER